jgi:hypothetical protein
MFWFFRPTHQSIIDYRGRNYIGLAVFVTCKEEPSRVEKIGKEVFESFKPDHLMYGPEDFRLLSDSLRNNQGIDLPEEMRPRDGERIYSIVGDFPCELSLQEVLTQKLLPDGH